MASLIAPFAQVLALARRPERLAGIAERTSLRLRVAESSNSRTAGQTNKTNHDGGRAMPILEIDAADGVTATIAVDPADTNTLVRHETRVRDAGCQHHTVTWNGRCELLACVDCHPADDLVNVEVKFTDGSTDSFQAVSRDGLTVGDLLNVSGIPDGDRAGVASIIFR